MGDRVAGRVVVVAGGSTGLGRGVGELFASEGADVVLLARRKERLDEAVAEIGPGAVGVQADIADPDSVRAAFAEIDARFGHVDVLLNVAGTARVRLIEEASDDDIATVVGTNFLGPIYTTRSAIPLLRRAGGGDIVNVSSEVTLDDMPLMTLYSCTKRALDGFSRTMTKELKHDGIRVALLVLGSTESSFAENFSPEDFERGMPAWQADGYHTRVSGAVPMAPAEVAEAMLFVVTRPRGVMMEVFHVRSFS